MGFDLGESSNILRVLSDCPRTTTSPENKVFIQLHRENPRVTSTAKERMCSDTREKEALLSGPEGWTRENRGPILAKKPCSQPQDRVDLRLGRAG